MLTAAEVRRRRIGGGVAAILGAVLIVLAVLAWTGTLGATDPSKGASDAAQSAGATSNAASSGSASSSDAAGSSSSANAKATLTVLNAGGPAGLAAKGKQAFESEGWTVTKTANLTGSDAPESSTVYYPAGDEEAHVAAQSLVKAFPKLTAAESPDGFAYDGVVVVLTGDWTP